MFDEKKCAIFKFPDGNYHIGYQDFILDDVDVPKVNQNELLAIQWPTNQLVLPPKRMKSINPDQIKWGGKQAFLCYIGDWEESHKALISFYNTGKFGDLTKEERRELKKKRFSDESEENSTVELKRGPNITKRNQQLLTKNDDMKLLADINAKNGKDFSFQPELEPPAIDSKKRKCSKEEKSGLSNDDNKKHKVIKRPKVCETKPSNNDTKSSSVELEVNVSSAKTKRIEAVKENLKLLAAINEKNAEDLGLDSEPIDKENVPSKVGEKKGLGNRGPKKNEVIKRPKVCETKPSNNDTKSSSVELEVNVSSAKTKRIEAVKENLKLLAAIYEKNAEDLGLDSETIDKENVPSKVGEKKGLGNRGPKKNDEFQDDDLPEAIQGGVGPSQDPKEVIHGTHTEEDESSARESEIEEIKSNNPDSDHDNDNSSDSEEVTAPSTDNYDDEEEEDDDFIRIQDMKKADIIQKLSEAQKQNKILMKENANLKNLLLAVDYGRDLQKTFKEVQSFLKNKKNASGAEKVKENRVSQPRKKRILISDIIEKAMAIPGPPKLKDRKGITEKAVLCCQHQKPGPLTQDLVAIMYSEEERASFSMTGEAPNSAKGVPPKKPFPIEDLRMIIDYVLKLYPDFSPSKIAENVKMKLNASDKIMKKATV